MREISLLLFIVLSFSVNAQIPDVAIAEDYTNPKTFMWKSTNEYRTGKIENGVYVSKAKKENASLGFSVDLMDMQKGLKDASDMEF